MPTSRRQSIVDAVNTRFAAITVANGYNSNIGSSISHWRDVQQSPFADNEFPALNYRDTVSTTEQHLSRWHEHTLTIEADVMASTGTATPADTRKLMADIIKAIGTDRQWSGLARDTVMVKDEIEVVQESKRIGGARVTFQIKYRTASFDPYNA